MSTAKNAIASYARTMIAMALALASSRWLIINLGESNFGLLTLINSIVVCTTFISSLLSISSARHFAFAIGQGNVDELKAWFNTALAIHASAGCLIWIIGAPIGCKYLSTVATNTNADSHLVIPAFLLCLTTSSITFICVPYSALLVAYQKIPQLAIFSIIQSSAFCLLSGSLTLLPSSRLVYYTAGICLITLLFNGAIIYFSVTTKLAPKLSKSNWFSKGHTRQLFAFSGWTFFGGAGATAREHGSSILINHSYGNTACAAYGVALQLYSAANQLSTALINVLSPKAATLAGQGNAPALMDLCERSNRYISLIAISFALPICLYIDNILHLWLQAPPKGASLYCVIILSTFAIDKLTTGYQIAISASGQIRLFQVVVGTIHLLTIPLAIASTSMHNSPTSILLASTATMALSTLARAKCAATQLQTSMASWTKSTVMPIFYTVSLSLLPLCALLAPKAPSADYFIFPTCLATFAFSSWTFCLAKPDRTLLINLLHLRRPSSFATNHQPSDTHN